MSLVPSKVWLIFLHNIYQFWSSSNFVEYAELRFLFSFFLCFTSTIGFVVVAVLADFWPNADIPCIIGIVKCAAFYLVFLFIFDEASEDATIVSILRTWTNMGASLKVIKLKGIYALLLCCISLLPEIFLQFPHCYLFQMLYLLHFH